MSNLFKRETLSGEFLQVNGALTARAQGPRLWTPEIREAIKKAEGSVQGIAALPEDVRTLFRTAWELPQKALIDMAAQRSAYIDQSQSLNLFIAGPSIGKLSSMYLYAWKAGLKTTYYLRSRPATRITQTTTSVMPTVSERRGLCRGPGLLAREPRELRGLPVTTATQTHDTKMLLDPGMNLTLRPMRYPHFYDRYRDAIKNTWTVEEVDLHSDLKDLQRLTEAERHLVSRLVAFFATGDTIVANNLVLNLYQHINSPEGRLYLSRQLFEEAVHVQFYLTLLDTYVTDEEERHEAFAAVENIPSIKAKADFCFRWIDSVFDLDALETKEHRRRFLLNLICFAAVIEGLFFYGAFAYVYFLRSRGLLNGLASGTNWVFRDESMHMAFAFDVVDTVREEEPDLFDDELVAQVRQMLVDGVDAEAQFAEDLLGGGVAGLSTADMRSYLEYVADRRMERLGPAARSTAPRTRSRSWSSRTSRSSRTSSSGRCRPTRSESREPSGSTRSSEHCGGRGTDESRVVVASASP